MFEKQLNPELFKRIRENSGLSQEDLANEMGWSVRTVQNYETDECKMKLSEFEKFISVTTQSPKDKATRLKLFSQFLEHLATKE